MSLRPTFVAFTPWTTLDDYLELCRFIRDHDLEDEVDPVQLSMRLLVPPGSLLLAAPDIAPYPRARSTSRRSRYRWTHPDPRMDRLEADVSALVEAATGAGEAPAATFGAHPPPGREPPPASTARRPTSRPSSASAGVRRPT